MGSYKISLKLGDSGYLECTEDNDDVLKKGLPNLIALRDSIVSTFVGDKGTKELTGNIELPNIDKPSSIYDAIEKVLATDWGKEKPRYLIEIHSVLAVNAIHIDKHSLSSRLTELTRKNRVRRFKTSRGYAYVLPLGKTTNEN